MRLSHTCARCGLELCELHAPPDPIYHLRVVVCPRCQFAAVRARPAIIAAWRRARLTIRAWFALLMRALGATLVLLAVMPPLMMLEESVTRVWDLTWPQFFHAITTATLADHLTAPDTPRSALTRLAFFVIGSLAAGAWTACALAHWRRLRALLAWFVLFALVLSTEPVATRLAYLAGEVKRDNVLPLDLWVWRLVFAGASALIAAAGVPIGHAIRRLWTSQGAVLRARARRRLRQRKGRPA